MSPPSATDDMLCKVGQRIWRACAGASVQIPTLYSRVFYFPQGHVEHCCPSSAISSFPSFASPVLCVVSAMELLIDPVTDEVFAHLLLRPIAPELFMPQNLSRFGIYESGQEESKVISYAKILTPSDANNGGGFSVPRYCADSIFPPLDFQADPPVQKLFIKDIRGVIWEFRHIYRGTPRRHLLTSGWTKYVNSKKLIAGDSVVFMRTSAGQMFIGLRRAPASTTGGTSLDDDEDEFPGYYQSNGDAADDEDDGTVKKVFRRTGKGKLTAEAVSEAINNASKGLPFEVVYYPSSGWSEFVVRAEEVEASMAIAWTPGTRVKMAMETEDSSRITWFQGVISSIFQETGHWRGSPWKPLQITWDEPEVFPVLEGIKRVNPWQVELLAHSTQLHASFPPTMRLRFPNCGGILSGEEGETLNSGSGPPSAAPAVETNPYLVPYTTFPAGMQGARHCEFGYCNPTGFIGENPPQLCIHNFPVPGFENVSTETNFGSPPSDDLSPNSNITYISFGNRPPTSARGNSIQLFGKTIDVLKDGPGLYEEDGNDSEVVNVYETHGSRGA